MTSISHSSKYAQAVNTAKNLYNMLIPHSLPKQREMLNELGFYRSSALELDRVPYITELYQGKDYDIIYDLWGHNPLLYPKRIICAEELAFWVSLLAKLKSLENKSWEKFDNQEYRIATFEKALYAGDISAIQSMTEALQLFGFSNTTRGKRLDGYEGIQLFRYKRSPSQFFSDRSGVTYMTVVLACDRPFVCGGHEYFHKGLEAGDRENGWSPHKGRDYHSQAVSEAFLQWLGCRLPLSIMYSAWTTYLISLCYYPISTEFDIWRGADNEILTLKTQDGFGIYPEVRFV